MLLLGFDLEIFVPCVKQVHKMQSGTQATQSPRLFFKPDAIVNTGSCKEQLVCIREMKKGARDYMLG